MKLSSILIASMLLVASVGFAQERAAPMRAVAHPPPNIEESTRFGWAVVLRVDPIYEQSEQDAPSVREECVDEQPAPPPPREHPDTRAGGTVIGAIVGGVIGNVFGKGQGRRAATAVGAVAGGVIGNNIAAVNDARSDPQETRAESQQFENVDPPAAAPTQRHCREVRDNAQRRIVGYDVEYRYGGEIYMARLAYDPGDRMRVKISVVPVE